MVNLNFKVVKEECWKGLLINGERTKYALKELREIIAKKTGCRVRFSNCTDHGILIEVTNDDNQDMTLLAGVTKDEGRYLEISIKSIGAVLPGLSQYKVQSTVLNGRTHTLWKIRIDLPREFCLSAGQFKAREAKYGQEVVKLVEDITGGYVTEGSFVGRGTAYNLHVVDKKQGTDYWMVAEKKFSMGSTIAVALRFKRTLVGSIEKSDFLLWALIDPTTSLEGDRGYAITWANPNLSDILTQGWETGTRSFYDTKRDESEDSSDILDSIPEEDEEENEDIFDFFDEGENI